MGRPRTLNDVQHKAAFDMFLCLLKNMKGDSLLDLADCFAVCVLECIAHDKGITDVREYPELAVQISHSIENEMRDYIEFTIDKEYGPDEEERKEADEYMKRKVNLSSLYGSTVKESADV